eukprot:2774206-Rhodomonas_salina.1
MEAETRKGRAEAGGARSSCARASRIDTDTFSVACPGTNRPWYHSSTISNGPVATSAPYELGVFPLHPPRQLYLSLKQRPR